jgi:splicing factor 3A subunit 2
VDYPEIGDGIFPRHRFMSAYEQKVEPPDRKWQYLLFAAEPYETIAFKVQPQIGFVLPQNPIWWGDWNAGLPVGFFGIQSHFLEMQSQIQSTFWI